MTDVPGEDVPAGLCPSCGNRVPHEGIDRTPDEVLCTPISCSAWRTAGRESAARHNARHILCSSLTGHFPFAPNAAQRVVDRWSDEEVGSFVAWQLPKVKKWDFNVHADEPAAHSGGDGR